jgi:hypothetical protein
MTKEGFTSSSDAYAQIIVIMLATSNSDARINDSRTLLSLKIVHLLEIMNDIGAEHDRLVRIVERYVDAREEGYAPTKALVSPNLVDSDAQTRGGVLRACDLDAISFR